MSHVLIFNGYETVYRYTKAKIKKTLYRYTKAKIKTSIPILRILYEGKWNLVFKNFWYYSYIFNQFTQF